MALATIVLWNYIPMVIVLHHDVNSQKQGITKSHSGHHNLDKVQPFMCFTLLVMMEICHLGWCSNLRLRCPWCRSFLFSHMITEPVNGVSTTWAMLMQLISCVTIATGFPWAAPMLVQFPSFLSGHSDFLCFPRQRLGIVICDFSLQISEEHVHVCIWFWNVCIILIRFIATLKLLKCGAILKFSTVALVFQNDVITHLQPLLSTACHCMRTSRYRVFFSLFWLYSLSAKKSPSRLNLPL